MRPISHCVALSVGESVDLSVCRSVLSVSHFGFSTFLSCLKVEKIRYEYFVDFNAPAQLITVPAQPITAPAQPPATGAAVYTALFLDATTHPYKRL